MSEICRVRAIFQNEVKTVIVTTQSMIIGTILIPSANLKKQMQSKPSSKKIQLLVETINAAHLDSKYKLEFDNLNERETLKNALVRIIQVQDTNNYAPPPNISLEQQAQATLLRKHPLLRKLFGELVPSQMTEIEFWSTRQHLVKSEMLQESQKKGVSLSFLSQDTSGVEGEGEKRFTLTPAVIQSIFIQYPSIKSAYQDNVPDKISEQEFWTRYFKSRLFHRIRDKTIHIKNDPAEAHTSNSRDEIFDRCLTAEMSSRLNAMSVDNSILDAYINLTPTSQDKSDIQTTPDFTMKMKEEGLIRGINRQSLGLLEHVKLTRREPIKLDDLDPKEEDKPQLLNISDRASYAFSGEIQETFDKPESMKLDTLSYIPNDEFITNGFLQKCQESALQLQKEYKKQNQTFSMQDLSPKLQMTVELYKSQSLEYLRHFWTSVELKNLEKARRMVVSISNYQMHWKNQLSGMKDQKIAYGITLHIYNAAENVIKRWNSNEFQSMIDR
eukprot:NODE_641_length_5078_cov_0.784093.p1 type:complete len:499 gc:universal NODE_641_length_5078_cov_0.784093:4750-3254(-)